MRHYVAQDLSQWTKSVVIPTMEPDNENPKHIHKYWRYHEFYLQYH